ncbi:MAG: DUF3089 domain-containing protein [Caulobacteraceae bacterium]
MRALVLAGALAAMALASPGAPRAQPAPAAGPPPVVHNDYANRANWLCLPDRKRDACDIDLDATAVAADGSTRIERFVPARDPPIDCFYVYPTVSTDPGVLATMAVEPAERVVIAQQFARFAAVCRPFAPLYRQFTLTNLVARMRGAPLSMAGVNPETPYDDVLDAWNYYLAHDNHGRGVVLIGHSQGSGMLTELIKNEIDGKPEQKLLVSAILMGTSLAVPQGKRVGGDFHDVPLCDSEAETGCVIAYASYRETSPPPPNGFLGQLRGPTDDLIAACVNPASLSGGAGPLKSYFPTGNLFLIPGISEAVDWDPGVKIATPFVATPGLLTARCVLAPPFDYLAIHVVPNPGGRRAKDIPGDVVMAGKVQPEWGLHLIDANLAMGNLIDLVRDEARAWAERR